MSPINLDYQENSPLPLAGIILLGLAILLLSLAGTYYSALNERVAIWESRTEPGQVAGSRAARSRTDDKNLALEVNTANGVLRQLDVPWEELFQAVEYSDGNTVTLLSMEPDVEQRQVKIGGEAKNFQALTSYVTRLQGQKVFGSVNMLNHHVQQKHSGKPVRFAVLATWVELP